MADDKTKFVLDLDAKGFTDGVEKSRKSLESLGDDKSLSDLLKGFKGLGVAAGVVGGAVLAAKAAFDMTLEADSIRSVEYQFDQLTKSVGVSGDAMKTAFMNAAGGLLDDTDAMKLANEQLVRFGDQAAKLPEVMELARKASAVTGKELSATFDGLATAIGNGNARALKQFGIFIDGKKVVEDYARANGLAVNEISEAGKRQAILNAALEQGGKAFKGINPDVNEAGNAVKRLGVAWDQLKESVTFIADSVFGKYIKDAIGGTTAIIKDFTQVLQANFGQGAAASAAQLELLEEKLYKVGLAAQNAEQGGLIGFFNTIKYGGRDNYLAALKQEADDLKNSISLLKQEAEAGRSPAAEAPKAQDDSNVNLEQRKQNQLKFEQDLLSIRQARVASEMQTAASEDAFEKARTEQRLLGEQEFQLQRQAIIDNANLNGDQKKIMLAEAEKSRQQQLLVEEQNLANQRIAMYEAVAQANQNSSAGIAAGAKAAAASSSKDWNNFSNMGKIAVGAFSQNATANLLALGNGSKDASAAMKGFFFGALADMAEAQGKVMIAQAFLGNYAAAAAGAGLIVLAGALRAMSGGAAGGGGVPGAGGGTVGGMEAGGTTGSFNAPQLAQAEQQKKAVSLVIQGSYYETEQTKTRLVEMIRQASDATDFNIKSVGE